MFRRWLGVARSPGRTRRMAAKGAWLVLAASLSAACTRVEIEDHSLQFNQAAGSLGNRMMLLNVVRAAKGYPVQFSKVTSYAGSSRLDGGVGLTIPFPVDVFGKPTALLSGSATPSATFKTGVSQLQLADLSTAEFQRTLRKQVTANDYVYYRSQGWPKALVNTLLIEEVLVEPSLFDSLRATAEVICGRDVLRNLADRDKREKECNWLRSHVHCLRDRNHREERASPEGDVVRVFANNPHSQCKHENFQWFFTSIRVLRKVTLDINPKVDTDECRTEIARLNDLASSAKDGKGKSKDTGKRTSETVKEGKVSVEVNVKVAEKADKDDDASDKSKDGSAIALNIPRVPPPKFGFVPTRETSALAALRNKNLCILKEGKLPIIVVWRSPERMVRYLGEVLAAQAFGSGAKKIEILDDEGRPVELLRVESGRDLLRRVAAVSVEGPEGESFYIPIAEREPIRTHLSLQTLALAMEAVNLAISGKDLPRAPAIFLPGG